MPKTWKEACQQVANEIVELLWLKQQDYGYRNILDFAELGCLVRANDKICRLKNLVDKEPENEKVDDSWADLAGYAIIALMLRRGTFTLPLGDVLDD